MSWRTHSTHTHLSMEVNIDWLRNITSVYALCIDIFFRFVLRSSSCWMHTHILYPMHFTMFHCLATIFIIILFSIVKCFQHLNHSSMTTATETAIILMMGHNVVIVQLKCILVVILNAFPCWNDIFYLYRCLLLLLQPNRQLLLLL